MNRRTALILGAVFVALIGVIGLTVYLLQSQQDVRSRADTSPTPPASTAQSCPTPAQVQNVLVEFPNCVGDVCNFTEASCSWSSVAGATKYQLTITEVDSNTVVKNEQIEAAVTRVVFPITQNKTYKCDVSAINSCGTSGAAGSHSLLCEVDAAVATPTPALPPPTSLPQNDCGFPCTSTNNCKSGLVCAIGSSGQGYCSFPSYEATCKASPSISSCCTAPTTPPTAVPPKPTLPPTGAAKDSLMLGVTSALLLMMGVVLFVL